MRVAPGYRGAPWAKPRTDHIADAPLIRATAVNVAAGTLNWKTASSIQEQGACACRIGSKVYVSPAAG
jgi:hypothetical protein